MSFNMRDSEHEHIDSDAFAVVDAMVHSVNWVIKSGLEHPGTRVLLKQGGIVSLCDMLDDKHMSSLYKLDSRLGDIAPMLDVSFKFVAGPNTGLGRREDSIMPAMKPLNPHLLDVLLAQPSRHYCLEPRPDAPERLLISTARNIKTQFWEVYNSREHRCRREETLRNMDFPEYRSVGDLPGRDLAILNKGYRLRGPHRCRWLGVVTLQLRRDGPLGCLIATDPCEECKAEGGDKQLYLSELAAVSLLLRQLLLLSRPNPVARQTSPDHLSDKVNEAVRIDADRGCDNYGGQFQGESAAEPEKKNISVLVVNMTPTKVRVIDATVRDPAKPEFQMVLREEFTHDLGNPEHSRQKPDEPLGCTECRKILAWLHFTASDSNHDPVSGSRAGGTDHEPNARTLPVGVTGLAGSVDTIVIRARQTSGESSTSKESGENGGSSTSDSSGGAPSMMEDVDGDGEGEGEGGQISAEGDIGTEDTKVDHV